MWLWMRTVFQERVEFKDKKIKELHHHFSTEKKNDSVKIATAKKTPGNVTSKIKDIFSAFSLFPTLFSEVLFFEDIKSQDCLVKD